MSSIAAPAENNLLQALNAADFRLIEPALEFVDLPVRQQLEQHGKPIRNVYFLVDGIASVVGQGERSMEVGLIGSEGMTGLTVLLGRQQPLAHETYMQVAGHGWRMPASQLAKAIRMSSALHFAMLTFVESFMNQTAQTVVSNGCGKLEQRLARWLLMVSDRLHVPELPLTHEFIGVMLGVQRSGVTLALQELERRGVIAQRRSFVSIADRAGLEAIAGKNYVKSD